MMGSHPKLRADKNPSAGHTREIVKLTGLVALITLALKPLGIAKEMVVAAYFGVSNQMDVYFLMLSIPMFFAGLIYRTC
ncbi:MAG: hypothetical protein AAF438_04580, partial [Pseudomonadota bacterium]